MSTASQPTTPDRLANLMIAASIMLLVTALPMGVVICLQCRGEIHTEWSSAITFGVVMAVAMALISGALRCTGVFLIKRRKKMEERRRAA